MSCGFWKEAINRILLEMDLNSHLYEYDHRLEHVPFVGLTWSMLKPETFLQLRIASLWGRSSRSIGFCGILQKAESSNQFNSFKIIYILCWVTYASKLVLNSIHFIISNWTLRPINIFSWEKITKLTWMWVLITYFEVRLNWGGFHANRAQRFFSHPFFFHLVVLCCVVLYCVVLLLRLLLMLMTISMLLAL